MAKFIQNYGRADIDSNTKNIFLKGWIVL